jgi:hypothetical protein
LFLEHDAHGRLTVAYKMLKYFNVTANTVARMNIILNNIDEFLRHHSLEKQTVEGSVKTDHITIDTRPEGLHMSGAEMPQE